MVEFWRSLRKIWSFIGIIQGIWGLLFLGFVGWFLGSEVLSSEPLGALLAVALPVGNFAIIWHEQNRRAGAGPANRLFAHPGTQFIYAKKLSEGRFPSENWATIARGPAMVAFAHPLTRRIPSLQRVALSRLLRDRRRLATAAGLDENWIAAVLVMPGKFAGTSVVLDGKLVSVSDLEATVNLFQSGIHTSDMVKVKFLSAIRG